MSADNFARGVTHMPTYLCKRTQFYTCTHAQTRFRKSAAAVTQIHEIFYLKKFNLQSFLHFFFSNFSFCHPWVLLLAFSLVSGSCVSLFLFVCLSVSHPFTLAHMLTSRWPLLLFFCIDFCIGLHISHCA